MYNQSSQLLTSNHIVASLSESLSFQVLLSLSLTLLLLQHHLCHWFRSNCKSNWKWNCRFHLWIQIAWRTTFSHHSKVEAWFYWELVRGKVFELHIHIELSSSYALIYVKIKSLTLRKRLRSPTLPFWSSVKYRPEPSLDSVALHVSSLVWLLWSSSLIVTLLCYVNFWLFKEKNYSNQTQS